MYLIVFTTLAIAILSTYTQVLAIEVGRIAAAQTGIAQAMVAWHTAAISMAASIIDTNTYNATTFPTGQYTAAVQSSGCSLTNPKQSGSTFALCPAPQNALLPGGTGALAGDANGVVMNSSVPMFVLSNSIKNKSCVTLPSTSCPSSAGSCTGACTTTFDYGDYSFYSILFQSNGTNYVVTYAAPASGSQYLTLAGGTQLSLTTANLIKQLRNAHVSAYSYGTVGGTSITGAVTFNLTLPTGAAVPSGAVALVSTPAGF